MPKILGSWSAMRKYLEEEMLCEALRSRVRYFCTTYPNMDGCGHFEVFVDGKSTKRFSMDYAASQLYKNNESDGFWKGFWKDKSKPADKRNEYDDEDFAEALKEYRANSIDKSIYSKNPIVRMFAILDRRVGKRTLRTIKDSLQEQPEWLRSFYELRLKAEKLI